MVFFNYLIYFLQKRLLWIYFEITCFVNCTGAGRHLQTQSFFLAALPIVKIRNTDARGATTRDLFYEFNTEHYIYGTSRTDCCVPHQKMCRNGVGGVWS